MDLKAFDSAEYDITDFKNILWDTMQTSPNIYSLSLTLSLSLSLDKTFMFVYAPALCVTKNDS